MNLLESDWFVHRVEEEIVGRNIGGFRMETSGLAVSVSQWMIMKGV